MTDRAYLTATIIRPDGTDTDVYGDLTEAGHGATYETGWYDPSWSSWQVWEDMESVRPWAEYDPDTDGTLAEWRELTVSEYFGSAFSGSSGESVVTDACDTYYGEDSQENYETGESVTVAMHFHTDTGSMSA